MHDFDHSVYRKVNSNFKLTIEFKYIYYTYYGFQPVPIYKKKTLMFSRSILFYTYHFKEVHDQEKG